MTKKFYLQPDKDAGWGLIYRLNNLWQKVDIPAEQGDYDSWNNILDRIYCNLLYRQNMEVTKDEVSGKIFDVKLNEDAVNIFNFLTKNLFRNKSEFLKVSKLPPTPINKNNILIWRSRWYHSVMMKDIWLRKYMQELGLYLKEVEKSPGTALFGGG